MELRRLEEQQPVVEPVGGRLPMTPSATRMELMQNRSMRASSAKLPHNREIPPTDPYGIYLAQYNSKYKQRMLGEMRAKLLASPISEATNGTYRIGGGRVVPLYESERLVKRMEVEEGGKWQWPHRYPEGQQQMTPKPPTVLALVDYVGRFDTQPMRRPGSAVSAVTVPIPLTGSRSFPNLAAARRGAHR